MRGKDPETCRNALREKVRPSFFKALFTPSSSAWIPRVGIWRAKLFEAFWAAVLERWDEC